MARQDLNKYIKKGHLRAVEKFNEDLKAFSEETGENPVTLYESANISFTLSDVRVGGDGKLHYKYDGKDDSDIVVLTDKETGEAREDEYDGIMASIKLWRACLRRAKRYWAMDTDKLDAIQNGEQEDEEEED